jgi:hypothetical protein
MASVPIIAELFIKKMFFREKTFGTDNNMAYT